MLKSVEQLVTGKKKSAGNHYSRIANGDTELYFYFTTCICRVDNKKKLCFIADGGYNTSSTNRAINSYISYFSSKGYKIFDSRKREIGRHIDLSNNLDFSGYIHYLRKEGKLK